MTVKMTPVSNSSTIVGHGYDPETQTMHIQFKSGGTYTAPGVPHGQYQQFVAAESLGKHFHANLRNAFKFGKV